MTPQVTARPTPLQSASRTAWIIAALLWPVALLNSLDRQMMAAMEFSILHIAGIGSEADWGNLPAVFQWVCATLSPLGGYLAGVFGGFADRAFGAMRDRQAPLNVLFGLFALAGVLSVVTLLLIRPRKVAAEMEHA